MEQILNVVKIDQTRHDISRHEKDYLSHTSKLIKDSGISTLVFQSFMYIVTRVNINIIQLVSLINNTGKILFQ